MGYQIQKMDNGTWLIEEEGECNVYMYLLEGRERALLIDTGYGTIPLDTITASLTEKPVEVLCTHGHLDHIGGNGYFSTVRMHRADRALYRQHRVEVREEVPGFIAPEPPLELNWFDGCMTLDLGGRTVEVFPVPGHTRGCVAALDIERRQLFTGDTCCKGAVLLHFDHSASVEDYRNAMADMLRMQERYDTTWPSHHARPVGKEILRQFLAASDLLLSGQAEGREVSGSRMFDYEDIMILY